MSFFLIPKLENRNSIIVERNDRDLYSKTRQHLDGRIFHLTSSENYNSIVHDKSILGYTELKKTHTQSINSYGRKNGYICLFDFREFQSVEFKESLSDFLLFPPEYVQEPVYLILHERYYDRLTFYNEVKDDIKDSDVFIHPTECWSKESIPTKWISKILRIQ
jgi:hypothetical protein